MRFYGFSHPAEVELFQNHCSHVQNHSLEKEPANDNYWARVLKLRMFFFTFLEGNERRGSREEWGGRRRKRRTRKGGRGAATAAASQATCDSPNPKRVLLSLFKSPPTSDLEVLTQPQALTTTHHWRLSQGTSSSGLCHVYHIHTEPTSYSTQRLGSSSSLPVSCVQVWVCLNSPII